METSSYGSYMVAMIIATEFIMEMRYTIIIIGVPIDGPDQMIGDNDIVVNSCSTPSITIKKRHNAIYYHQVREDVASGVTRMVHIPGKYNPSDILTEPLGPHQHNYPLMKELLV